ncbi:hypothetical protein RclHR1_03630011 [Rhizophagus clarus]|uniref:Uncharacterized protein n=1 Tax=Rhizophagus clarus TaxID=94130 RepID=A0A2Z6RCA8_9GLOM|nr:hypothetical protein RclHR1_03630011 [Rhizophagus clarus]
MRRQRTLIRVSKAIFVIRKIIYLTNQENFWTIKFSIINSGFKDALAMFVKKNELEISLDGKILNEFGKFRYDIDVLRKKYQNRNKTKLVY